LAISFIDAAKQQFLTYKELAEKAFLQLSDDQLFYQFNEECNSIAMIIHHMRGNMRSRWTDFLTTDGEKSWRERDAEFEPWIADRSTLIRTWEEGWSCLFHTLDTLTTEDLMKIISIRNQEHTVIEAINRQLAHYPYHVGQIVYIGKMLVDKEWKSLSIPKKKWS